MPPLTLPFQIPGYRILRRLGLGGMATVYLAIQQSLGRPVAIKVLSSACTPSDDVAQRFEREARTIAQLDHPHIVSIFDVGRTSNGQFYYTMPYLPNGDLSVHHLQGAPDRVLGVIRALAEALGCAHDQGIVHRDVKPENVLFDRLDRPLLTDFGIALNDVRQARVTREGTTIGSSGYMSPEQARGQAVDGRSDLYSLGVLCHELLTGELPFVGADALATALAHIERPVPRLPVTRRIWQPLVDKALAKHPDARFQSAEEMLAALDVIEQKMSGPPRSGLTRWWPPLVERFCAIPRRYRVIALSGFILLALAGLLALLPHEPERTATGITAQAADSARIQPEVNASNTPVPAARAAATTTPEAATSSEPPTAVPGADSISREQHLQQATDMMSIGRMLSPDGKDAASEYLAILAAEPHQSDAMNGIARILNLLAARAVKSIDAGDITDAIKPLQQGADLAARAKLGSSKLFAAFAAPIHAAVAKKYVRPRDPFDSSALDKMAPLLPVLERIDPKQARALQADLRRPAELLRDGGRFKDANGPDMLVISAKRAAAAQIDHAFAISVGDVSRAAYARFASASGRAPARCRESQRILARSRGLGWRTPGFVQSDDHPVVCVSWDDANAYAQWLSQRTGAHYRLPTQQEWLLLARAAGAGVQCSATNIGERSGDAAHCNDGFAQTSPIGRFAATAPGVYDISGNVSVWMDGCAKPGNCREHAFRGLSWRDDDTESNLKRIDSAGSDIGYANVGFRLVRELPASLASH
ncbi:MAG: bifunctional serine/threonine-protein kinase/formylglycine-generating enzyme family protein [Dokdonella sp.]